MQALSTLFTPSSWCSDRYAVFIDDHAPATSIIPPSSGWVDPSFTRCIPSQYTTAYPTFSPGVCLDQMGIVRSTSEIRHGKTIWTAACCQRYARIVMVSRGLNRFQKTNDIHNSGFSPLSINPEYLCTSNITSPMTFLLDPNISTTDVYTTLAPPVASASELLWVVHDQITVQWEQSDLQLFPEDVASQYACIMGITELPTSIGGTMSSGTRATTQASPADTRTPLTPSTLTSETVASTMVTRTMSVKTPTPSRRNPLRSLGSTPSVSDGTFQTTLTNGAASVKDVGGLASVLTGILLAAMLESWVRDLLA
jgi:hypothetical protein